MQGNNTGDEGVLGYIVRSGEDSFETGDIKVTLPIDKYFHLTVSMDYSNNTVLLNVQGEGINESKSVPVDY